MNVLELLALVSRIQNEAPVLIPDALKVMQDLNQVLADFEKLLMDYQATAGQLKAPLA